MTGTAKRRSRSLEAASDAVDEARAAVDVATECDTGNEEEVKRLEEEVAAEERRHDAAASGLEQRARVVIRREREHARVGGAPLLPIDLETRPGLGLQEAGADGETPIGTTAAAEVRSAGREQETCTAVRTGPDRVSVQATAVKESRERDVDETRPVTATLRATRTGWHSLQCVRGAAPGTTAVVAIWRTEQLTRPQREEGVDAVWLRATDGAGDDAEMMEIARDLARYFVLGWTESETTVLGKKLAERRHEPYPTLIELARKEEPQLCRLAFQPAEMSAGERATIAGIGRRALRILDENAQAAGKPPPML